VKYNPEQSGKVPHGPSTSIALPLDGTWTQAVTDTTQCEFLLARLLEVMDLISCGVQTSRLRYPPAWRQTSIHATSVSLPRTCRKASAQACLPAHAEGAGSAGEGKGPAGPLLSARLEAEATEASDGHGKGAGPSASSDPPTIDRFVSLLESLGVPERRARQLAERAAAPPTGLPDPEQRARPMVDLLRGMGLRAHALRRVVSDCPRILSADPCAAERKLEFLVAVGVRPSALAATVEQCPALLLAPVFQMGVAVSLLEEAGVAPRTVPMLLERFPSLFVEPAESRLVPVLAWLREDAGLSDMALAAAVQSWPQILLFRSEELQEKMDFLMGLGLRRSEVCAILQTLPAVFGMDLQTQLQQAVGFLQEQGISGTDLSQMLKAEPRILQLNFSPLDCMTRTCLSSY